MIDIKVWVCVVRREAFVGGESQRCRHTAMPFPDSEVLRQAVTAYPPSNPDLAYAETILYNAARWALDLIEANGFSACGEMELIGGEPVDYCVVHEAKRFANGMECHVAVAFLNGKRPGVTFIHPCQFESQVRVGP